MWKALKKWAEQLRRDILTLSIAMRDERTPLWLRLFGFLIIAYALSPIDLMPDFIPFIGFLDELILLPVGLWILIKFLPAEVLANARMQAGIRIANGKKYPCSMAGAIIVIAIWMMVIWWLWSLFASAAVV